MGERKSPRGGSSHTARRFAAVLMSAAVLAATACGSTAHEASTSHKAVSVHAATSPSGAHWICVPGQPGDPCGVDLAASAVAANGHVSPATAPRSPDASKFDCFYVHPTDSLETVTNTSFAVTTADISVTTEQAAPFSQVCNVWAPAYRAQTWPTVRKALPGGAAAGGPSMLVAYDSLLPAWRWFVAHTGSTPIVLMGDSQGAALLIRLISGLVDHEPAVLRRLIVAIIVGGNLQVPTGHTVGGAFTKVPVCTSSTQTGCAIAFSSFPSEPPADAQFGRPGQGVSGQSDETATVGQAVACVNPAAIGGGTGDLEPYLLTATQGLKEKVHTPWVTYPGLYSVTCEQGGGASWLQLKSTAGTGDTRPVVSVDAYRKLMAELGIEDPAAWGYHGYEFGLALGNFLHDVTVEEAAWEADH